MVICEAGKKRSDRSLRVQERVNAMHPVTLAMIFEESIDLFMIRVEQI